MVNRLFFTLGILLFLINCNILSQDGIILIYTTQIISETLAREAVYEGDKLVLYYDGTIERYSRYYPDFHRKIPAREVLIKTSRVPPYDINQLNKLFTEYLDIFDEEMPSPDPSMGNTPRVRYNITFYFSESDYYVQISAYDILSHEYTPRFNMFLEKLKEKLYAFIKEPVPVKILPQNPTPYIIGY